MNPAMILDLVSILACLASLVLLLRSGKEIPGHHVCMVFFGLIVFTALYCLLMNLESSGITLHLNYLEDLFGALIPMWWIFLLYTILRDLDSDELQRSEEKFRKILSRIQEGYYEIDRAGNFIFCNDSLAKIFGEARDTLSGANIRDFVDKKTHERGYQVFNRVYTEGKPVQDFEWEITRRDGTRRYVEASVLPMKSGNGGPDGFQGIIRDVTERRTAEISTRESHDSLQKVLDGIDADVYVSDMETHEILLVNSHMSNSYGLDLVGKTCWEVFRGDTGPCDNCTNGRLMDSTGQPVGVLVWEGQNPITGKWYTNHDRAILWKNGHYVRLQVATDITRIKQAEESLYRQKGYLDALHETSLGLMRRLELNELLETIIERAGDLVGTPHGFIYLYDADREDLCIRVALGGYRPMIGFRLKPGKGMTGRVFETGDVLVVDDYSTWAGRSPETEFDDFRATVCLPLKSGSQITGVIGLGHTDPDKRFSPDEIDSLNRFAELASIAMDNANLYSNLQQELADRKQAEAERRKLEIQIQQAQKIEAIGTLAGGIAHNFNNLLMGIQGNAALTRMTTDPANPNYGHLTNIEKLVQSGSKLTAQLLGYARKGRYEVRVFNLNQLVRETSGTFGAAKKEITIHLDLADDLQSLQADQGQIEQVLLNLFVNAADAMPAGGELFLKTCNVTQDDIRNINYQPKPGRYVMLSVRDTGTGMGKKTMERIFEPFFTTKGLVKGTGLGLASAYGIIKGHGGYIEVESEKGKGSVFRIFLPATEKEVVEEKESPGGVIRGNETVLLVDDEPMILEVGREIIETLGYRALVAGSGEEAVDLYRERGNDIDLIILDMIMPDMSGSRTFDQLKEIDPEIKVLLSSGYTLDGQANEIIERGCDAFIQKPFDIRDLSHKMRQVLDQDKFPKEAIGAGGL